jgi:hypothetical protein
MRFLQLWLRSIFYVDRQRVPMPVQRIKVKRYVEKQHRTAKRRACLGCRPARLIKQAY